MSSITEEIEQSSANNTNEISLHEAMLNSFLAYDPTTKQLHFPDGYFINSIYLKRKMSSENLATDKKDISTQDENSQTYDENISYDISNPICDESKLLKEISEDLENLKFNTDSSKKYGLTELFNKYNTLLVTLFEQNIFF